MRFGENGESLGATLSDQVAAKLRRGRMMTVPDAGHFLPMEKPELVIRESLEFLAGA
ncbi:MAG: alpha/beta fold hydrolase [Candidatus Binataceae bacterium]